MGILTMKKILYAASYLGIISLLFQSCDFNDQEIVYEEKLVVFASIVAKTLGKRVLKVTTEAQEKSGDLNKYLIDIYNFQV